MGSLPDDTIVLRQEIIDGIKKKYKLQPFREKSKNLYRDLESYTEEDPIGKELVKELQGQKLPHHETITKRVLKRTGPDAGARLPIRNLLCHYAFGMNWEEKMRDMLKERYDYQEELITSRLIKNKRTKPSIQTVLDTLNYLHEGQKTALNEIRGTLFESSDEGANIKNILNEALTAIDELHKISSIRNDSFLGPLIQIELEFSEAHEKMDVNKIVELSNRFFSEIKLKRQVIDTVALRGFYTLLNFFNSKGDFEQVISLAPAALELFPRDLCVRYYYALALVVTKRSQEAFGFIADLRSEYPEEMNILDLECMFHCVNDDYVRAIKLFEKRLALKKNGLLYYFQVDLRKVSIIPDRKIDDIPKVSEQQIQLLLLAAYAHKNLDATQVISSLELIAEQDITLPMKNLGIILGIDD